MRPSRRTILTGSLRAAAACAVGGKAMTLSARENECLMLSPNEKLDCTTDALEEAAKDFGHVIRKRPSAVFRPSSAAEIAEMLKWAARRGLKVAARGMGHSIFGRAMTDGGIVIDMRGMSAIHRVEPRGVDFEMAERAIRALAIDGLFSFDHGEVTHALEQTARDARRAARAPRDLLRAIRIDGKI